MVTDYGEIFASAEYASIQVPTYPSGQIGAFMARKRGGSGVSAARVAFLCAEVRFHVVGQCVSGGTWWKCVSNVFFIEAQRHGAALL